MTALVVDLSDEFISVALGDDYYLSDIRSTEFWDSVETASKSLKAFLDLKNIRNPRAATFTLPIKALNFQIVTLPEKIKEREKKVLLGLELDKTKFTNNFNYKKLEITQRTEDGTLLCDYMILGPKRGVLERLESLSKLLNIKTMRATPSFMLFSPRVTERLSATVYLSEDRSEITLWGAGQPLSIAVIPNTGDQLEDINRFIAGYFDKVENLDISVVRLYGPRMRDASLAFSLSYPNEILKDPAHAIAASLAKAQGQIDILIKTKLPKPPIAVTPRNLTFLVSALGLIGLIAYTSYTESDTTRYKHELQRLSHRAEHMKQVYAEAKKLEDAKSELETERDFYLKITKRRAPWHLIMYDLGDLTPRNMWFERFNAIKNNVMIAGKATSPEDVAALSLNLSNSSRYFEDAQVVGMRDYKEADKTYTEFQLTARLKSPLSKTQEGEKAKEAEAKAEAKVVAANKAASNQAPFTKAAATKTTATHPSTTSHPASTGAAPTKSVSSKTTSSPSQPATRSSTNAKASAVKAANKAYHAAH